MVVAQWKKRSRSGHTEQHKKWAIEEDKQDNQKEDKRTIKRKCNDRDSQNRMLSTKQIGKTKECQSGVKNKCT